MTSAQGAPPAGGRRTVSRSVVVPAPSARVFDLLADPRRHGELDGSGTVKGRVAGPSRLCLGAAFRMRMQLAPGLALPYVMRNEVVEFEEGTVIAWRHLGHHVWRWQLAPVPEGTLVTETFDWSRARSPLALELLRVPGRNATSIEATLARLPGLLAG